MKEKRLGERERQRGDDLDRNYGIEVPKKEEKNKKNLKKSNNVSGLYTWKGVLKPYFLGIFCFFPTFLFLCSNIIYFFYKEYVTPWMDINYKPFSFSKNHLYLHTSNSSIVN